MFFRAVLACFVVVVNSQQHVRTENNGASSPIVEGDPVTTAPSGVFRGIWMETRRGRRFEAYRGIRYAEPPVGELRFQPPKPILQYPGEVNATADGPACPRPVRPGAYVDEDCLVINVYTPKSSSKLLPVIFYIHSGGFYSMSGRSDLFGPHYLLDRDVVLITINYRLATLGFLSTGDENAPGNNGIKDQVTALRWVQRNIGAFGGDPNLVTIAGCSAGSTSVMLHMISPMSKGLFHRAISMSGSPTAKVPSRHDMLDLAVRQAQLVNCSTHSNKAIVDCLKTKSWRELGDSLLGFFEFGFDPVGLWRPVVENDFGQERFLTIEPMDAIREGKMHAVPYIISQTRDEFFWKAFTILNNQTLLDTMNSQWERVAPISLMVPREDSRDKVNQLRQAYFKGQPLVNDSTAAAALGRLYGDAITAFSVHRLANLMCRHSPEPVYYYELTYVGEHSHYEDPITKKPTGVAHHDDLIYLFSMDYRFPQITLDSPDSPMVDKMTAIFYNFARYGDPNPREDTPELGSLTWPAMTAATRQYLRVDKQMTVDSRLKEDRLALWDQLYPIQY